MGRNALIEKADRLLSKEKGTVFKEPGGKISICLVYPNTYHVGMSNLGFQAIYTLLNERDDVLCERAFLPDEEDYEEYIRSGAKLFSLESKRPLGGFDIVAFSLSFENDFINIPRILELAKIPVESGERMGPPLLMAGGICVFSNPEPLAAFFDIFFVGEAEEMLHEFIDVYKKATTKDDLLRSALGIEGLYVPRFYDVKCGPDGLISERTALDGAPAVIRRRYIKDLSKYRIRPSIITPETEFSGMYLIEAMRGCPWSCSFCLAGHVYGAPRRKPLDVIKGEIAEALKKTRRVGIIGPSLSDFPYAEDVLRIEGVEFSITSLRASPKSAAIVALLKGHRSVSIAPEAGTERLRRVINKRISEEDIIETARQIFSHGIRRLKLYFMVGLPTETHEDIEGIVGLVGKIRETGAGEIVLTLSTFVPKPFTPFQRLPMAPLKTVKERMDFVRKSLAPPKVRGVRVFHDVPKYAYMQGMLAMGDRRVAAAIKAIAKEPGGDWIRASVNAGVDPDFYIFREKGVHDALPWDFISA